MNGSFPWAIGSDIQFILRKELTASFYLSPDNISILKTAIYVFSCNKICLVSAESTYLQTNRKISPKVLSRWN